MVAGTIDPVTGEITDSGFSGGIASHDGQGLLRSPVLEGDRDGLLTRVAALEAKWIWNPQTGESTNAEVLVHDLHELVDTLVELNAGKPRKTSTVSSAITEEFARWFLNEVAVPYHFIASEVCAVLAPPDRTLPMSGDLALRREYMALYEWWQVAHADGAGPRDKHDWHNGLAAVISRHSMWMERASAADRSQNRVSPAWLADPQLVTRLGFSAGPPASDYSDGIPAPACTVSVPWAPGSTEGDDTIPFGFLPPVGQAGHS